MTSNGTWAILYMYTQFQIQYTRPKKKDSCVQVLEVKKIRVGRSKNIFILDFFFHYKCTEVLIEDRGLEVSFFNQSAHCID